MARPGRQKRVVPYVKDTKNALVVRFEPARSSAEMASLQAAFKEAIQQHFQLEPRELACEPMPAPADRTEILFYEASEGGAGVLRQIVEDPDGDCDAGPARAGDLPLRPGHAGRRASRRRAARPATSACSITATSRTIRCSTAS